jgi:hypothetical protein
MMNRTNWTDLLYTDAPAWSILVRLLVGLVVFLPEGIQKLIFPDILGAGRFARIGIPFPDVMGPFVGVVETVCGALIIVGFVYTPGSDSIDHYHDRGSYFDQTADPARARCLDISSRSGHQAHGLLEHDARSAGRSHNAARLYLPPHCRGRALVIGCAHST